MTVRSLEFDPHLISSCTEVLAWPKNDLFCAGADFYDFDDEKVDFLAYILVMKNKSDLLFLFLLSLFIALHIFIC